MDFDDASDLPIVSNNNSLLQLTVLNKVISDAPGNSRNKIHNFHFKVKENGVDCFYPGSQA